MLLHVQESKNLGPRRAARHDHSLFAGVVLGKPFLCLGLEAELYYACWPRAVAITLRWPSVQGTSLPLPRAVFSARLGSWLMGGERETVFFTDPPCPYCRFICVLCLKLAYTVSLWGQSLCCVHALYVRMHNITLHMSGGQEIIEGERLFLELMWKGKVTVGVEVVLQVLELLLVYLLLHLLLQQLPYT